jgi:undecaprenyl-diphosphatase
VTSAPRPLAVRPAAPALLPALALAGAGVLGWAVLLLMVLTHEGFAEHDAAVTDWVVAHRDGVLTTVMTAVSSSAASALVVVLAAGAVLAVAARTRSWTPLSTLVLAGGGAGAGAEVLKALVRRSRPPLADELGAPESGYGFPSAHTLVTAALVAAAAVVVWRAVQVRAVRLLAAGTAVVVSGLMGASRLYLGDHWASDVLASYALAVAVVAAAVALAPRLPLPAVLSRR